MIEKRLDDLSTSLLLSHSDRKTNHTKITKKCKLFIKLNWKYNPVIFNGGREFAKLAQLLKSSFLKPIHSIHVFLGS